MNCFYCGKRVSMVRKRSDADFCSDDHRQKYHARARRTIETLREADEQIAAARRLNDCLPPPASLPKQGKDLAELMQRNFGTPLLFGWMPTGLPVSRARLDTWVPGASVAWLQGAPRVGAAPAPRPERVGWSIGHVQEGPRPPRAFSIAIKLPQGGLRQIKVKQAARDGARRYRTAPPVELGVTARAIARRIAWRPRDKSIAALLRTVKRPDPIKPPPPSPPIVVTLRHATMAVTLGCLARPKTVVVRMPAPGMVEMGYAPRSAGAKPMPPAYVRIEPRKLSLPAVWIAPGAMPHTHEMQWGARFVPCPDGFRRRQFYPWETPERFLGMGFETVAGHRPELRIAATPHVAPHLALAHLWSSPLQDASTALPEPRRPAPPFAERLSLPHALGPRTASELPTARPGQVGMRTVDSPRHFPTLRTWDGFAGVELLRRQGTAGTILPAQWASGTAEAFAIPGWARAHTRGAKRIASQSGISVRQPVFKGPGFVAGRRRAGPSPEKPLAAPVFAPASTQSRHETVLTSRATLLPELPAPAHRLRSMAILESACRAPLGQMAAQRVVHPAYEILLATALPAEIVEMAEGGTLRTHPPARQTGVSVDIRKGSPQVVDRESMQRFRKRGYEAMRSRHTAAHWPAVYTPGLRALATHGPRPHPLRAPNREAAAVMFRAHDLPAADAFRRACALMGWRLLEPARPGSADWGRIPHPATVALPLPLMLPLDALGPIRDWGLAPPPEPEKPPEPIHEDFGAGLANWLCAHADWRQDIAGVRTGSLALLRPSLNMADYEFEFLGKIENRSIGWVFRAANTSNYHAVQIALDAAGTAHLARYSVVAGDREQPAISPLDLQLAKNSSCRVKLCACGSDFKLFVNDKPAFDWSDDRLPEGGVGFFSDGEDHARLYWVKVTPYYDARTEEEYPPIASLGAGVHREIRMGV